MKVTVQELANALDLDYLQANILMKILIRFNVAYETERVFNKRGRPTARYEVPENITINLNPAPLGDKVCQNIMCPY